MKNGFIIWIWNEELIATFRNTFVISAWKEFTGGMEASSFLYLLIFEGNSFRNCWNWNKTMLPWTTVSFEWCIRWEDHFLHEKIDQWFYTVTVHSFVLQHNHGIGMESSPYLPPSDYDLFCLMQHTLSGQWFLQIPLRIKTKDSLLRQYIKVA